MARMSCTTTSLLTKLQFYYSVTDSSCHCDWEKSGFLLHEFAIVRSTKAERAKCRTVSVEKKNVTSAHLDFSVLSANACAFRSTLCSRGRRGRAVFLIIILNHKWRCTSSIDACSRQLHFHGVSVDIMESLLVMVAIVVFFLFKGF